jgi:hypothetical protein
MERQGLLTYMHLTTESLRYLKLKLTELDGEKDNSIIVGI